MSVRSHTFDCAKVTALLRTHTSPATVECTCASGYVPGAREQASKGCPCGGVILADTDDLRTPLCIDCHEEHSMELAEGLRRDLARARNSAELIRDYHATGTVFRWEK